MLGRDQKSSSAISSSNYTITIDEPALDKSKSVRADLMRELSLRGLSRLKTTAPPPPLERQKRFHQLPPPPIQSLDAIEYESEYEKNKIELVRFKVNYGEDSVKKAITKVPSKERRIINATYTVSSLGTGLACTTGIMTRFNAPLAIGGAGFTFSSGLLIGLTIGCGAIAIGLAYLVHKYYTKEALKKAGLLIKQRDTFEEKNNDKGNEIQDKLYKSFAMLVKLQITLNELKSNRKAHSPASLPSEHERHLKNEIDEYINFLVIDPNHPNMDRIEHKESRENAKERAANRQLSIRVCIEEASKQIQSGKLTLNNYLEKNSAKIAVCFPSLELRAPREKTQFSKILLQPSVGISTLGGFTGVFGLSYTALTIISFFTVVSMAFPPLYAILGLAAIGSLAMGYSMYKIKRAEAERKTEVKNLQKQHGYLTRADVLLSERYQHELEFHDTLLQQMDTTPHTTNRYLQRRPQHITIPRDTGHLNAPAGLEQDAPTPPSTSLLFVPPRIDISTRNLSFHQDTAQPESMKPAEKHEAPSCRLL